MACFALVFSHTGVFFPFSFFCQGCIAWFPDRLLGLEAKGGFHFSCVNFIFSRDAMRSATERGKKVFLPLFAHALQVPSSDGTALDRARWFLSINGL